MDLVVDANDLFSAAIKDSATARLLINDDLRLHAPEYLFEEFGRYRETLLDRTHRDSEDFSRFVEILRVRISIHPRAAFRHRESAAEQICPDPGDIPYFALALLLDASIWSDDRALRDQPSVPVLTTTEVLERLDS